MAKKGIDGGHKGGKEDRGDIVGVRERGTSERKRGREKEDGKMKEL